MRSDLDIDTQVKASGATWIDRQLVAREPASLGGGGFGAEVQSAMTARADHLIQQGLARRQGQQIVYARSLLDTLRERELDAAGAKLAAETGTPFQKAASGDYIAGAYRQRLVLSSGRFAMIDDGLGFRLVPWSPSLETKSRQARLRSRTCRRRGRLELRPQAGSRLVSTRGPCPEDQYFFAPLRRLAIAVRLPLNADEQAIFLTP